MELCCGSSRLRVHMKLRLHTCIRMYACIHSCIAACMYVCMYVGIIHDVCVYVCMYVCVCVCTSKGMYAYYGDQQPYIQCLHTYLSYIHIHECSSAWSDVAAKCCVNVLVLVPLLEACIHAMYAWTLKYKSMSQCEYFHSLRDVCMPCMRTMCVCCFVCTWVQQRKNL
jgi:hypothetical protein